MIEVRIKNVKEKKGKKELIDRSKSEKRKEKERKKSKTKIG